MRKSPRQDLPRLAKDVQLSNRVKAFASQRLALVKSCDRACPSATAHAFKVLGEIEAHCRELGTAVHADAVDVFLGATIFVREHIAQANLLPRRRSGFKDVSRYLVPCACCGAEQGADNCVHTQHFRTQAFRSPLRGCRQRNQVSQRETQTARRSGESGREREGVRQSGR